MGKKKQRVMRLNLDGTFDEMKIQRDGGKLVDGENRIGMEPACVFTENKTRLFRGKRRFVFYVEGTASALRFENTTDAKDESGKKIKFNPFWTMKEAAQFVEKKIAESLEERKPMTWTQFIILAILGGITCFAALKVMFHIGA